MLVRKFAKSLKSKLQKFTWILDKKILELECNLIQIQCSSLYSLRIVRVTDQKIIRLTFFEKVYLWQSVKKQIKIIEYLRKLNDEAITLNAVGRYANS